MNAVVILLITILPYLPMKESAPLNVYGKPLESCCTNPMTGYYRNGFCQTGTDDLGTHITCAVMTETFLQFTKSRGNDLSTPVSAYNFPGLKPGDKWCLCILRWKEAHEAGLAPPLDLAATNIKALQYVDRAVLETYAIEKVSK